VSYEGVNAGIAQEAYKLHQMRENLGLVKAELNKDQEAMGLGDEKWNHTRAEVEMVQNMTSMSGALHAFSSETEEMLGKFNLQLAVQDAAISQADVSLREVFASVSSLRELQSSLNSTSEELATLRRALSRKGEELSATRAQQVGAIRSLNQLTNTQARVAFQLEEASRNVSLMRAKLAAEEGKLKAASKDLAMTRAGVKDFEDMDVKLGAAQRELKAYQDALSARTSELGAMHGEVAAARTLSSATGATVAAKIKDVEQIKAKLLADGVRLISASSKVEKIDSNFRLTGQDSVYSRRPGLSR